MSGDQLRDLPIMERARVQHRLDPVENGSEQTRRQPEGMEHRQRVEEDVGGRQHLAGVSLDLERIGDEVRVRQRHALRNALRAGGKKHDRGIVGPRSGAGMHRPRPPALNERPHFVEARDRRAQVLDQTMRRPSPSSATTSSSLPWSTNRRDVTMVRSPAKVQAARRFLRPAVKLSKAGTRPTALSPNNTTARPCMLGRSTPTRSPGAVSPASLPPSTKAPRTRLP